MYEIFYDTPWLEFRSSIVFYASMGGVTSSGYEEQEDSAGLCVITAIVSCLS